MDALIKDTRYAIRSLLNARGFAVVAILTLALGIGATTAMFSVVNAVLLRPLPFRDPQQLVQLGEYSNRRAAPEVARGSLSYPDFADVRERAKSLETVAAYTGDGENTLTGAGGAIQVHSAAVSTNLFPMLGVQPVLGRTFAANEDEHGHYVVVVSDRFWRSHFNGRPDIIGKSVALNGRSYEIVGVMPPGFQFPIDEESRDLWRTFSSRAETDNPKDEPTTKQRGNHSIQCIARLKPGVTLAQANSELNAISRQLAEENPKENSYTAIGAAPEIRYMVGETRTPLLVLLAAVGLVLLIACANVANLLLARSSSRMPEIAIRAALGAKRSRIVRQLVTESLVLSVLGGALGVGVASWSLAALLRLYPQNLPRAADIGIDLRVLLFTAGLAMLTGVLFGIVPALQASSPELTEAMRSGGRTTTSGPRHAFLRAALVVAEVAVGVVLLTGAGLLMRSFYRLSHVDLGMNPDHVVTANFDLSTVRYKAEQMDRFVTEVLGNIRAVPGVISAGGAVPLPLSGNDWTVSFDIVERHVPPQNQPSAGFHAVQPGFFEALQIPLLRGRTFDARDTRDGTPTIIISESLAKKYFPNEDPLGKLIDVGIGEGTGRERYKRREVVGIVGDVRMTDLTDAPMPNYYVPQPQLMWQAPTLLVRTAGDPMAVTNAIRKIVLSMDPDSPLYEVKTMDDYLALALGRARFQAILLSIFAGFALLLTAIGLYGVIAYAVVQRTHEIGVRMALGAQRTDVLQMVLQRGVVLTLAGIGTGVVGALALAKVIESLLFEIPPRDPATYVMVVAVLGIVALLASFLPALRATRVDPMVALRYE